MGRVGGALVSAVAFLFPGQGSQKPGMGKELAEAFPESRRVFDAADMALGSALSRTCFEGTEAELALTETTQPAVLTVSAAALAALEARGVRASAAAGHSLGEYGAHVAAGTFAFEDAVRTVRARGRFMQDAVPVGTGAMAAIVGLPLAEVDRLCTAAAESRVVCPANLNGPDQTVVSGHADAVDRLIELARAQGAKRALRLSVSAPFHCPLMEPAAIRLAEVLEGVAFAAPRMPVYANYDAKPVASEEDARRKLVRQVTAPVRWQETVAALIAAGYRTFVEVGPGNVLAGLVRRIDKDTRVFGAGDPAGVESAARGLGVPA